MTAFGELPRDSSTYIRTHALPRLRTQHEVPRGFESKGCLMLGRAERGVEQEPVPNSRSPRPGRPGPEKSGTSCVAGDLRAPFVSDALLLRAGVPCHDQGETHDERQRPAHARQESSSCQVTGMSALSEWMTEQYFSIERSMARRAFASSSPLPDILKLNWIRM